MSKYYTYRQVRPKPRQIHPIWRGIGCLMFLIIPVISIAAAWLIVDNIWTRLPYWMIAPIRLPWFMYRYLPQPTYLLASILGRERLLAYIIFTLLILIVLSGILSFAYAIIYRLIGPPRYSPIDAPPPKAKVKRYRR
jgi:hypothetical protein